MQMKLSKKQADQATLKATLTKIRSKYGPNSILTADKAKFLEVHRMSTGVYALDFALGGGYPYGRYVHVFGAQSSGKTFLAMRAVAALHRDYPEAIAVWLDIEQVFDEARATAVGIDLARLVVIRAPDIESSIRLAEEFLDDKSVKLFIIDSVAAISLASECEGDVEDQSMGSGARLLNRFMRRWIAKNTPKDNTVPHSVVLLLNQVRETIRRGGNPNIPVKPKPPGGHGLRFFSSIELEVRRGDIVELSTKDEDAPKTVIGYETKVKVEKNNTFPPGRVASFLLCVRPFKVGNYSLRPHQVDDAADILRYGCYLNLITRGGAWYVYKDHKWKGKIAAQSAIAEDTALEKELFTECMAKIYEKLGVKKKVKTESPARRSSSGGTQRKKTAGKRK